MIQGFNVYLQGANAERVNSQLKREKVQKYKRNESLNKERKNWSNQEQRLFSNESVIKIILPISFTIFCFYLNIKKNDFFY